MCECAFVLNVCMYACMIVAEIHFIIVEIEMKV